MSFFYPFIISLFAGLSTMIGVIPIFFKWKREMINSFIVFSLCLSLTIMIGISITELIPEASFYILTEYKLLKGTIVSLICFLSSITFMLILSNKINQKSSSLYSIGILSMITLMIHNLPEGIITFFSATKDMTLGLKIGGAILLHNIPEGISIALPIYFATGDKMKALFYTLLSAIAEPLGAIISYIFLQHFISNVFIGITLIVASGFMITLSIHDLFPKSKSYHQDKFIYLGFLGGFILLILTL